MKCTSRLNKRQLPPGPGPNATVSLEAYDDQGRLIGVYSPNGTGGLDVVEELVYLDGWRAVATIRPDPALGMASPVIYPIVADHLGSPRKILDLSGNLLWSWTNTEPYGYQAPNETISGSTFVYDGRFPGQRFDASTGALHNGFRTYSPKLGRYMQSDPLGLVAGWNTYGYVEGDPLIFRDPFGLSKRDMILIRETFQSAVQEMNSKNLRNENKLVNNVFGRNSTVPDFVSKALGYPVPGYLDCVGQTNFLMERLQEIKPQLDDEWMFSYDYAPYHQWTVALPMNKSDTPIWMDPRANEIKSGSPCRSCGGLIQNGQYTKERVDEILGR